MVWHLQRILVLAAAISMGAVASVQAQRGGPSRRPDALVWMPATSRVSALPVVWDLGRAQRAFMPAAPAVVDDHEEEDRRPEDDRRYRDNRGDRGEERRPFYSPFGYGYSRGDRRPEGDRGDRGNSGDRGDRGDRGDGGDSQRFGD